MFSKKNIIMFLAGAEAFHTLMHLLLKFSGTLPLVFFNIEWNAKFNMYAIIINATITAALLWWASEIKK